MTEIGDCVPIEYLPVDLDRQGAPTDDPDPNQHADHAGTVTGFLSITDGSFQNLCTRCRKPLSEREKKRYPYNPATTRVIYCTRCQRRFMREAKE